MADKTTKIIIGAETSQAEAALRKINGTLGQLERGVTGLQNPFRALGPQLLNPLTLAATGFAALTAAIVKTANAGEEMGKFAQQAGVSVEWISGMKYAAEQSETSIDSLVTGIGLLSKGMAEGGEEGNKITNALDALGISARNADGTLRPTEALFSEIAEKFSRMEDGAGKTALAMQLFGRSAKELIPLLNEGAAGTERMRKEAERLGIVFSEGMAKASDQFNDNIDKMTFRLSGLAKTITGPVIAAFNSFWEAIEKPGPETEASLIRLEKLFEVMKQSALPGWSSPFGALKSFESNPKIAALIKAQEENDKRRARYDQMSPQDRLIEDVLSDTQHRRIKAKTPSTAPTGSTPSAVKDSYDPNAALMKLGVGLKSWEQEQEERQKEAAGEALDTWQRDFLDPFNEQFWSQDKEDNFINFLARSGQLEQKLRDDRKKEQEDQEKNFIAFMVRSGAIEKEIQAEREKSVDKWSKDLTSAIDDALMGGENAFENFFTAIAEQFRKQFIDEMISKRLVKAFHDALDDGLSGLGGQNSAGGLFGSLFSGIGSLFSGGGSGGLLGSASLAGTTQTLGFTNAFGAFHDGGYVVPRFHHGIDLRRDEVPAILQTGEGVLSRRGMSALDMLNSGRASSGGPSGGVVNVHFNVQALDADGVDRVLRKHADKFIALNVKDFERNGAMRNTFG